MWQGEMKCDGRMSDGIAFAVPPDRSPSVVGPRVRARDPATSYNRPIEITLCPHLYPFIVGSPALMRLVVSSLTITLVTLDEACDTRSPLSSLCSSAAR